MKKVWTLIACFAACLSLAACGTDSNSSTPGSTVATTTTAKTEAADKTEKNHRGDNRGDQGAGFRRRHDVGSVYRLDPGQH